MTFKHPVSPADARAIRQDEARPTLEAIRAWWRKHGATHHGAAFHIRRFQAAAVLPEREGEQPLDPPRPLPVTEPQEDGEWLARLLEDRCKCEPDQNCVCDWCQGAELVRRLAALAVSRSVPDAAEEAR